MVGIPSPGSTGKQADRAESRTLAVLVTVIDRHWLTSFLIHNRYELMTDCWKEEPCSRPSFFQLIEKLEVIMQRDAPYLDLDKHNEDHPYYNVPPEASGDEEGNMEKEEPQDATSIDSYL